MIDANKFYKLGFICFLIIALCSLANFFVYFGINNIFSKISSGASTVFNFILAAFFYYLVKTQTVDTSQANDIQEEFKELENGE